MIMGEGNYEYHPWLWTSCSTWAEGHLLCHLCVSLVILKELVPELTT